MGDARPPRGAYLSASSDVPVVASKRSPWTDLAEVIEELRGSRDLIQQLTLRDIRIRYKQAIFGFAWALLMPMFVVLSGLAIRLAFSVAAGRGIDKAQVVGLAIKALAWSFVVGCLNQTTPSLLTNKSLVTKIYFPREVLPLSAVLTQTADTAIGALLIFSVFPFLGITPSFQLLWIPLLALGLWIQSVAAGLFLSCANIFFRDVKYLVQVFLTFGIFTTPVLLDATMLGERGMRIIMLNPVSPLLEGLRLCVVQHHNLLRPLSSATGVQFWTPWYLAYSALWGIVALLAATVWFHRSERRFAELV
ncbi:MAG: ABC transporter permease [Gemmatimonadota bacterium]